MGGGILGRRFRAGNRPKLDGVTLLSYGALGCLGFLLNGLGPSLPFLQRELGVSRAEVAWYPLLYAAGLLGIGLVGERIVGFRGRRTAFWSALVALCLGAAVLASAVSPLVSGVGAAVMGAGGALLVLLVPAILSDRHGRLGAGAIAEANAISSASAVTAPLLIAGAVAVGAGWRIGLLFMPLLAVGALTLRGRHVRFPAGGGSPAWTGREPASEGGPFFRRWLDILLVVSVEFCLVFWSTDYLASEVGIGTAKAAAFAALFLGGMALGRGVAGQLAEHLARPRPVFIASLVLAALGFAVFWSTEIVALAAAGLLLTGLGVALLYPLSVSRALSVMPISRDRASARAALASGLAIGVAPFSLAALSAEVGLRTAFVIVPVLLAAALANALVPSRRRPPREATRSPVLGSRA